MQTFVVSKNKSHLLPDEGIGVSSLSSILVVHMKKIIGLLSIVVLLLLVAAFFFYPVRVKKTIQVPYTMYKSAEQVNNGANLVKWFSSFIPADSATLQKTKTSHLLRSSTLSAEIANITMYGSTIQLKKGSKKQSFSFVAVEDSAQMGVSNITLSYSTTPFRKWISKSALEREAEKSLDNLKDFMADTHRFYGFEIQEVTVQDTAFLFIRETVPVSERRAATKKIYERLIAYANEHNAGYNGTRIYHTLTAGDEITIFASIGVTNMVEPPASSGIEYKRMPFGKNLLVASYQGKFKDSYKALNALEAFKIDHTLTSMAIPFQKFMSDGYDFADDQVVQLKIYYPVF